MLDFIEFYHKAEYLPRSEGICSMCHTFYDIKKNYQIFCSDDCELYFNLRLEFMAISRCELCGKDYKKTTSSQRCLQCLKATRRACQIADNDYHKKKRENNPKPKSNKKKKSPAELTKIFEYKRVFNDRDWSHYLKGRRWDRI